MSIPNLGLSEKQVAFLAHFKGQKTEVFSPRSEVFQSQKQRLTESAKLIGQLNRAWDALNQETARFKTRFPDFSENELSQIVLHIENWGHTKNVLDQTVNKASSTYVPEEIRTAVSTFSGQLKQAERYMAGIREYLDLRAIERDIDKEYHNAKRDYQKIENLHGRYHKLSLEIRNFIQENSRRMLDELMGKVDLLRRFNKSMDTLQEEYSHLPNPVRNGSLVFAYSALASIKKDLSRVPGWLSEYKKLAEWVDTQSEEDRNLLIGPNPEPRSNKKGEYKTYTVAAEKMKMLQDESSYFYRAADICASIEALAKNMQRKKQDVDKLWRTYSALDSRVSKHIGADMVALLNGMLDSQDKMAQVDEMIASLDKERTKCNVALSGSKLAYTYDKYAVFQAEAAKAEEWMANYKGLCVVLKNLQGKLEMPPAKSQKLSVFKSHAEKLELVLREMEKVTRAYDFEMQLVHHNVTLTTDESSLTAYRKEFEKLPADVRAYVSAKWEELLNQFGAFRKEQKELVRQISELKNEYDRLDKQWKEPSYAHYNALAFIPSQEARLAAMLDNLKSDLAEFKRKYNCMDGLSLNELNAAAGRAAECRKTVEELRQCHSLYEWAKAFETMPKRYSQEELREQYGTYYGNSARYLKYDANQELAKIFKAVEAEIAARTKARQRQASRDRTKQVIASIFAALLGLLAVGAMVYMILQNEHYVQEGAYWRWFLITAAIGVAGAVTVGLVARSKAAGLIFGALSLVYLLAYSLPMYLRGIESVYWYLPWIVMGTIILVVIAIVTDTTETFMSIFFGAAVLFLVGIVIWGICISFREANFFEPTFFGQIGNFFIGAFRLIFGLIGGILRALSYLIGGGFWLRSLEAIDGVLNAIFFCLAGGFLVCTVAEET